MAGSTVAARLAQQGRRVMLVERETFPSDTISTHALGLYAVDSLRRLGVLDRIEAAGFRRLYRHRAWVHDICVDVPAGPPGIFSMAPRRNVLDLILRDHAVECGAQLLQRARVDGLLTENGSVTGATVQVIGGDKREIRARVVVGADGKQSQVAQWVGAEKYDERPLGRPIYYGYFHGVTPLPDPAIEMFFGSDRIGFCFPMRPDEHCLIIEAQPDDFAQIRGDAEGWFRREYVKFPTMAARIQSVVLEDKMRGTRGVENFFRKPYGPGWALTGDAAYVKDPCTGYGVGDALLQSFLLARSLGAWLDGAEWEPTMRGYQERRDTALRPTYEQTAAAQAARDMRSEELDPVRVALLAQYDIRILLRGLPNVLDQLFEPMDRLRHAVVAQQYAPRVE